MPCHTHIHMLDQIDYNHQHRWIVLNIYDLIYFYLIGTKKLRQAQFMLEFACCLRCNVSNKQP